MKFDSSSPSASWIYPRLLSIAGSDSGGGAGIQADLKTFAALGCYGMTAITALTAQNTCGVQAIHAVPEAILNAQIDAVVQDIGVDGVKIGMLHSAQTARTVAHALDRHGLSRVVFDPVMVSAAGSALIDQGAVQALVEELFPRVRVITPNLDEAALLLGQPIVSAEDLQQAAVALLELGTQAVLLKGGHLAGAQVLDVLAWRDELDGGVRKQLLVSPRIATRNLHGAGCTLSSALAAYLALGLALPAAVQSARDYVHQALQAGAAVRIGAGVGPLNHGFAPESMRLLAAAQL
jgi:hydroxymethylpyrimidine/phosphomethylpyrimidine kinase